jgi:hypothetical protein
MVNLRIIRRDRGEQLLAECQSSVLPARGEVIQLDTVDSGGVPTNPSTLWKVVGVTLLIPSVNSSAPRDGSPLGVKHVEVTVVPDAGLFPQFAQEAEERLSESRM